MKTLHYHLRKFTKFSLWHIRSLCTWSHFAHCLSTTTLQCTSEVKWFTSAVSSWHFSWVWHNSGVHRCWYMVLVWRILKRPLMIVVVGKWRTRYILRSWLRACVGTFAIWSVLLWGCGWLWRVYWGSSTRCHHSSSPHWIHWCSREQVGIRVIPVCCATSCSSTTSCVVVITIMKYVLWNWYHVCTVISYRLLFCSCSQHYV